MRDWIETLVAHELAYSFLSKVFYEPPDKELIENLTAEALFDDWPLETDQTEVKTGLALLRRFCASWREDDLEALRHDYRRLFIGPGYPLAPLWESVYCSPDHLLFGVQTIQVRKEYQRFGMPIPNLHVEPEDHLGLELRFVAYLCAIGLEAVDQQQRNVLDAVTEAIPRFMSEHLLQWSPDCLRRVIENAASDYYRGCAHLTLGCLLHTQLTFQVELAE